MRDENNATVVDSKAGLVRGMASAGVCRKGVEGVIANAKETEQRREREGIASCRERFGSTFQISANSV